MDKKQYAPSNWVRAAILVVFFGALIYYLIVIPAIGIIETKRETENLKAYIAKKRMKAISDRDSLMHINQLPE